MGILSSKHFYNAFTPLQDRRETDKPHFHLQQGLHKVKNDEVSYMIKVIIYSQNDNHVQRFINLDIQMRL